MNTNKVTGTPFGLHRALRALVGLVFPVLLLAGCGGTPLDTGTRLAECVSFQTTLEACLASVSDPGLGNDIGGLLPLVCESVLLQGGSPQDCVVPASTCASLSAYELASDVDKCTSTTSSIGGGIFSSVRGDTFATEEPLAPCEDGDEGCATIIIQCPILDCPKQEPIDTTKCPDDMPMCRVMVDDMTIVDPGDKDRTGLACTDATVCNFNQAAAVATIRTALRFIHGEWPEDAPMSDLTEELGSLRPPAHTAYPRALSFAYTGSGASALAILALGTPLSTVNSNVEAKLKTLPDDINVIFVMAAGHVAGFETGQGSAPTLHQEHTEALASKHYVVVVNGLEPDPVAGETVRLGIDHSTQRSVPCGWAKNYCVSSHWEERTASTDLDYPGNYATRTGSRVPLKYVAIMLDNIWKQKQAGLATMNTAKSPTTIRKEVIQAFLDLCAVPVEDSGPDSADPQPSELYGQGYVSIHNLVYCTDKTKEYVRASGTGLLVGNGISGAGALGLAGATLRWQAHGIDAYERWFPVDKVARSHAFDTPLARLAPGYGRSGKLSVRWTRATGRFSDPDRQGEAAMQWNSGRHIWGFSAPGFDMAGGQWQLASAWRTWVGIGVERGKFVGGDGTGSWRFGDTDHLQWAVDGNWRLANGWSLQSGVSLAHFYHRQRNLSLVGGGTGDMAEAWVGLRKDAFSMNLQMNSGLHGSLQLQKQWHALVPRPQTNLSLNWQF